MGLELREAGRDGDADLGITRIMRKAETIGTDNITEERGKSLQETCIFFLEGFNLIRTQKREF